MFDVYITVMNNQLLLWRIVMNFLHKYAIISHDVVVRYEMLKNFVINPGVGGAVRFLVVGTIGQRERPPRGQLWVEQCLTSLKYWPI